MIKADPTAGVRPLPQPPDTPDLHGFVMIGTNPIYLSHLPMFYEENHCYQLLCEAKLSPADQETFLKVRAANPDQPIITGNHQPTTLEELIARGQFLADTFVGMPTEESKPFMTPIVKLGRILHFKHFSPTAARPKNLTYWLYGNEREVHLTHVIAQYPDFQQELDLAALPHGVTAEMLSRGVVPISIPTLPDKAPVLEDPLTQSEYGILIGTTGAASRMRIGRKYFFDADMLNKLHEGGHA